MCHRFDPKAFGALLALYEHRTYLAGILWGLNSFDQWGVERGKVMAGKINSALAGTGEPGDETTDTLINYLNK